MILRKSVLLKILAFALCFVMLALCSFAAAPSVFAESLVLAKAETTSMLGATNRLTVTAKRAMIKQVQPLEILN